MAPVAGAGPPAGFDSGMNLTAKQQKSNMPLHAVPGGPCCIIPELKLECKIWSSSSYHITVLLSCWVSLSEPTPHFALLPCLERLGNKIVIGPYMNSCSLYPFIF